jgi:hypothetical protein
MTQDTTKTKPVTTDEKAQKAVKTAEKVEHKEHHHGGGQGCCGGGCGCC